MTWPAMRDPAHELPISLRIVSYNCWGLKYLAKYRHERLSEIGQRIGSATPTPQIVALQECWTQQDFKSIRESTRQILPYGKFYHAGAFGAGLAILSKWPIVESSMDTYPLNGRPTAFFRGDWFVGKGVACARIRFGPREKDIMEVFCTHLHAPYEKEPNDSYVCHRTTQAWEIAKLMRHAAERGHLVLGLGDFNMIPDSLAHRIVEGHARVKDVWKMLHPDSAVGAAEDEEEKKRGRDVPSASECISEHGTTCDSKFNTWRWSKNLQKKLEKGHDTVVDGKSEDPKAKRLDYIFFGSDGNTTAAEWQLQDANVGMLERHPTLKCSLSDHFSIEATLVRQPLPEKPEEVDIVHHTGKPGVRIYRANYRPQPLSDATYNDIMRVLDNYMVRERRQRRLRIGHFFGQVTISVACLVAVWFSPRNFVSFILMLISSLGLSYGVVDGLMGLLFFGSEIRSLKEFQWELANSMHANREEYYVIDTSNLGHWGLDDSMVKKAPARGIRDDVSAGANPDGLFE